MARALLFLVFLVSSYATIPASGEEYSYVKSLNPNKLKMRREKLSHFRLYWHDIFRGSDPTSVTVVQPVNNSSTTRFGSITILDNPLTVGSQLSSTMVGRAQGLYAAAGKEQTALLMIMSFAFTDGKYNGSTFTVQGRNQINLEVREMEVIGGSGLFRFARGYVEAGTSTLNNNGDATVEYNCYILHY